MKRITLALLIISLSGCGPAIRVYSDHDPDFDLLKYSTYRWGANPDVESGRNPLYYNELNDKRIKSAVDQQLASREYHLTSDNPQLTLHYHIIVEDASLVTSDPYGPYWIGTQTHIYQYTEGTLILDVMDTSTKSLIWRGWAVSAIDETYGSEEIDRLIKTAVDKIFKKFPGK